jgi:hypothetical protein
MYFLLTLTNPTTANQQLSISIRIFPDFDSDSEFAFDPT